MKIGFRQGIVRYQLDPGTQQPIFLQKTNGGATIDLIVAPNPTIVTIADGATDYLISESKTINEAFSGFTSGIDYWLYVDINTLTGERTFGHTLVEPTFGPTAPATPVADLHWFDTTTFTMRVWVNGAFEKKLRVFLAKYDEGSVIQPYPIGSQVNLNTPIFAGYILFDEDNKPVRKFQRRGLGTFLTTESIFTTHTSKAVNVSFELQIEVAQAIEPLPIYSVITYDEPGKIKLASHLEPEFPAVGIVVEDFFTGEISQYVTQGYIDNAGWNWTDPPGTPLFVGPTGEITTSVPQSGSIQRVGFVIGPQQIYLSIQPIMHYDDTTFSNLVITQIDKVTGELVVSNVPGGGGGVPTPATDGYQHIQSLASDTWTIIHNKGTTGVIPLVYLDNKQVIPSEVEIVDVNTVVVTFDSPQVGFANLVFFDI